MKFTKSFTRVGFLAVFIAMAATFASVLLDAKLSPAAAQSVSSIVVTGNERIDRQTIITYVTIDPGTRATPVRIDESIQALFATGLFKDVSISRQGSRLLVKVVENPVVNGVAFVGNDKLDDDQLKGIVLTKARGVFNREQVAVDVKRMKEAYKAVGRFGAAIKSSIEPLGRNRVNVVFRIQESAKTGIAKIRFVGNKVFGDSRLRNAITTRQTGLLSFLSSNDVYDEQRLAADEEKLRRFYFNHGYADFEVVSSVVDLDEGRNKFFITITVKEGQRYRFGTIDIDSILLDVDPEVFRPLITTKEGQIYDARKVERTIEALSLAAAGKGFAFAQVRPRGEQAEGNRINITYAIDQGPRVFVERINIIGNTRTREYVIRREFDIAEGDAFNQSQLDKAERRLRNLNIFKNVKITRSQGSVPDRIVLNVQVDEEPTGDVSFGVGANLAGGFLTNFAITERNFLGRGQFVRAAVGLGTGNRTYDISFTEPYFLGRRISAGFDLFRRATDSQDSRSFDTRNNGFAFRFGFPLTEKLAFGIRYTLDAEKISNVTAQAPLAIQFGDKNTITSSVGYTLTYNTLDNNQNPTNGFLVSFSQDFAGLGGDVRFVKSEARVNYFKELNANNEIVANLKGRVGNITGLGQKVGILDNFFGGGDLVRGFETRGIGPRQLPNGTVGDDAVGGRNYFAVTAEVQFPAPILPRSAGLKLAVFADAGSVFGFDQIPGVTLQPGSNKLSIRSSVGAGFIWKSPFGPLRGDFAYVISSKSFDDKQFFRIGGGTRF